MYIYIYMQIYMCIYVNQLPMTTIMVSKSSQSLVP